MGSDPFSAVGYDLVVIGAGVNGAGIAREAARGGWSVLVLEQTDLASGTTSASTRLIHGGLRYLEHAELGLVRESLREREALLEIAPHLIEPLKLYLPVYRGGRRPRWQIRMGLTLYDLLSWGKSLPSHRMLGRDALLERVPALLDRDLVGGACYYDAQIRFPERLVVENLLDAAAHGARVLNHTAATAIVAEHGRVRGVEWRRADGTVGAAAAGAVVNAAGPWLDRVTERIVGDGERRPPRRMIGGTKGSHLVVEPFPGAPDAAIYAEAARDGRPFFVIPWNDLYLIGTTDVRYDEDPGDATIGAAEHDYLCAETERLFPRSGAIAPRVLYTQSGVRALPYAPGTVEGAITRRHLIHAHRDARGLYSIVGGKLTTYRSLAAEVVARLERDRGRAQAPEPREAVSGAAADDAGGGGSGRVPARRRRASPVALPGALAAAERDALVADLAGRFGERQARRLVRTYGGLARELADDARARPELAAPAAPGADLLRVELVRALESEWAQTLIDVLQRRSMLGLGPDFGLAAAPAAARALEELGFWDAPRAERELAAYAAHARRFKARQASSAGCSIGSKRNVGRSPRRE